MNEEKFGKRQDNVIQTVVEGKKIKKEIKVKVTFTEGYEKRFTQACLDVLKRREKSENTRCAN